MTLKRTITEKAPSHRSSVPWTPLSYQRNGVKYLLERAHGALLLDPGCRKTSITLATLKILFAKKMIKRVFIIAPLRPCWDVWPAEIEKWSDFNHLTYDVLHGPNKEENLQTSKAQILIINPAGLLWLLGAEKTKVQGTYIDKFSGTTKPTTRTKVKIDMKRFRALGFDVLVIDELTAFKNQRSDRYKLMLDTLPTFSRRIGLTGSVAANGLLDLFPQCYMLDMGRTLGRFITHYRKEYFDSDYHEVNWTLKPGAEERIYERLAPLAMRIDPQSAGLDLPEMVHVIIDVELPVEVRKIYNDVERDMLSQIEDKILVASNAAGVMSKLRQIASGGVFHYPEPVPGKKAEPRQTIQLHNAKTEALQELAEELQGSPLLCAYDFEHDLARLRKAFPKAIYACDYKPADFKKVSDRWNAGEIPILFGHPQSIGHGLNLQEAGCHVAWYSMLLDFELYDQFNRRVLRSGNKFSRVFVHHLVVKGTIERVCYELLCSKDTTQKALFSGIQRYAALLR